ncbi:tetratricopeptide (TPR) repeat protein [Duganella sp. 1411]|uniref:tetratricopeptide repeat protein n=1 Tax=Duganella sp. 1411 TaxID=2806572 RepID=UPI001AE9E4B1|nr:tetratricopeptide repeat protein [Duganella sp. 1411]MBP1206803.1 tetratricopeptide (TPR) repeat protein [Duganella sp. 1411]
MDIRHDFTQPIAAALRAHGIVVVAAARGLGAGATARAAATAALPGATPWELDGDGHTHGYLAGFEPFIERLLDDADGNRPALVARHEQSLKRLWPRRPRAAFRVPRDLTGTAPREERTRFYHHEYQNKLLVGLAEFVIDAMADPTTLVIDNAERMPPTSRHLLDILRRLQGPSGKLRFILLDRGGATRCGELPVIALPPPTEAEFDAAAGIGHLGAAQRRALYVQSGGNPSVCKTLATCLGKDLGVAAALPVAAVIDLHLATLGDARRAVLAADFVAAGCRSDPIGARNAETMPAGLMDDLHHARHAAALERHLAGAGPLVLCHALAIRDPARRLEALVEPCDVLMGIGLYDTWFEFFAALYAAPRRHREGSDHDAVDGLFINAAFVLYSMGYTGAALAFLNDFLATSPHSRFVPTALYAQSMTYGRYQIPVDLAAAEACALRNLRLIDEKFHDHPRHAYIKVFAENAYAYIKARQGKFDEALALCEQGIADIVKVYGEDQFQLHRSILIYNTSQVYELVDDAVRAEQRLREAIACDPFYAEYYNDLGNLLSRLDGREEEALAAYAKAIALSPPYHEAHLNRGMLRAQRGDTDGARADFERALVIKPSEWRALRELGNLRLMAGDAAGALAAYDDALRHEARDADLLANAGMAASELGDSGRAIRHALAALAVNPRHAGAHNNLAAEFMALGQRDEALAHIRRAIACDPDPRYRENEAAIMRSLARA